MNFFIADVQEGFGAFVAFYLADLKWSQETIGLMLTVGNAVSAVSLIPGGALADALRRKRLLVAAGIIMIAAAALILDPGAAPDVSIRARCGTPARDDRGHHGRAWQLCRNQYHFPRRGGSRASGPCRARIHTRG
jgi:hypothetical protein